MFVSVHEVRVSHLASANHRSWQRHWQNNKVLGPEITEPCATEEALHSHLINVHGGSCGIGEKGLLPDRSLIRR